MNTISRAVNTFPLKADGGRAAEYVRIVSVVSMGVVLAIGAATVSTLRSVFAARLDDRAKGD